jgi:hypothetical protein
MKRLRLLKLRRTHRAIDDGDLTPTNILRDTSRKSYRNAALLRWVIPALVVDIVLTFGAVDLAVHLHDISQEAQKVSCIDGNHLRASEERLWVYVFEKIEPAHPTASQKVAFDAFYHYLNKSLKTRDCAIY